MKPIESLFEPPIRGPLLALTSKEALDRHLALTVSDGLGLRLNRSSSRNVYHYTTLPGLLGIISDESLWASDHRFLNDRTEFSFGLDVLEMLVAFEVTLALDALLREEVLLEIARMRRDSFGPDVLSASFCRKGNTLSQWRAYGRQDAVAVGFNRDHLTERAVAQGYDCGAVHYYWAKNEEGAETLSIWLHKRCAELPEGLRSAETRVHREGEPDTGDSKLDLELHGVLTRGQRLAHLRAWIALTAAFIKHPAFSEEAEWRCVRVIDGGGLTPDAALRTRVAGTKVVPYADFDLRDPRDGHLGMEHVVLGPSNDPAAVSHAVGHLTRDLRHRDGFRVFAPFHPVKV